MHVEVGWGEGCVTEPRVNGTLVKLAVVLAQAQVAIKAKATQDAKEREGCWKERPTGDLK